MSGGNEHPYPADTGDVQSLVRECVLFGLLFKAAMFDLTALGSAPLKLSYRDFFEDLSVWAEKRHHLLRGFLREQGCELLTGEKRDSLYCVHVRVHGYVQEIFYSIELLKAECQQRIKQWLIGQRD